jgi:hypothetical protein
MSKLNTIYIKTSKAVFLADIHFGVRSSSEEWQDNIKDYFYNWFIPYLKNILSVDKDYSLFILGDVFDDRKSIDINVNEIAIDIFEILGSLVSVYIINGNHDLSKKTNKGNTSLRTFTNIPGITVIKEPTLLKIKPSNKILSNIIAIPYLGNHNEENKVLLEYSNKTNYAFMHTDISQMKFDNGMTIIGAVDSTIYKGKILSGHIHKRQEMNNVIYIGSPYQLRRSDIGNKKGIYKLDFKTNEITFDENLYSPIFHKIPVDKFLKMNISDRNEFLNNNYNDILIDESELRKYKMTNIYDIANLSNAKRVQIIVNKSKHNLDIDDEKDYKELSIEELINESIMQLDIEDNAKNRLKNISHEYIKTAENDLIEQ